MPRYLLNCVIIFLMCFSFCSFIENSESQQVSQERALSTKMNDRIYHRTMKRFFRSKRYYERDFYEYIFRDIALFSPDHCFSSDSLFIYDYTDRWHDIKSIHVISPTDRVVRIYVMDCPRESIKIFTPEGYKNSIRRLPFYESLDCLTVSEKCYDDYFNDSFSSRFIIAFIREDKRVLHKLHKEWRWDGDDIMMILLTRKHDHWKMRRFLRP